ncbi:MAG: hypothetical protein ACRDHP_15500 [Ktedonobacterales bacterium]
MGDMDQGIKRLIQTHPQDVLHLAFQDAEFLDTLPVDVATEPQLVLDTLLRVRMNGEICAVDIEAEAQARDGIAKRLADYGTRARTVTGLKVFSVVLWLESGGVPPPSPYVEGVGALQSLTWSFTGIELYREDADVLLTGDVVGLLPLVPFCRGGKRIETIEHAAQRIKTQAPASDIGELEALLAVFGARTFGDAPMQALIRRLFMSTEILETSPLYQLWVRKATEEGMAQGMAQGKIEGLREGTIAALRGRFGELSQDVIEACVSASAETLTRLLGEVSTLTLEHVRAELGLQ